MKKTESEQKETEEFRVNFRAGVDDLVDLIESMPGLDLALDPLTMGFDERGWEELTSDEKRAAEEIINQKFQFGLDGQLRRKIREYKTFPSDRATVPGEIRVLVYETEYENIFLHEFLFVDGEKRWKIGPNKNL